MKQQTVKWQNWAKNISFTPSIIHYPQTEEEIITLVRDASLKGQKIRVIGNGHSFTPLGQTNEVLVSLSKLQGIISINETTEEATVWAGTSIQHLNQLLFEQGYNLINLGDIDVQSIAGATATGTHGTGIKLGNLSSQITHFRIVTAAAEVIDCSAAQNKALFQAGKVSLGALGIITQITLRVTAAYRLDYRSSKASLTTTLERLDEYNNNNRNFEFYWFPYTNTVQLKMSNITTAKIKDNATMRYLNQHVMENTIFQGLCNIGKWVPSSYATISKIAAIGVSKEHKINESHLVYASPRNVRFKEMEYNIPRVHFKEVMKRIVAKVNEQKYRLYFPVECRFVQEDDIWLSPAYKRASAYIAIHVDHRTPHNPYFKDIELIMKEYNGRPHWGKMHHCTAETLAMVYPKWDDFIKLRAEIDPQGIFLNDYLSSIFGVELKKKQPL